MDQSPAFQAARQSVLHGFGGLYLIGPYGSARTEWVRKLLATLPAEQIIVGQIDPTSTPDSVLRVLSETMKPRASGELAPRAVIVVNNAERLYSDTLDVFNAMAALLRSSETQPRLLIVGSDSFTQRMKRQNAADLLAHLATRIEVNLQSHVDDVVDDGNDFDEGAADDPDGPSTAARETADTYSVRSGRAVALAGLICVASVATALWFTAVPERTALPDRARLAIVPSSPLPPPPGPPADPEEPSVDAPAPPPSSRPDNSLEGQVEPAPPSPPGLMLVARRGDTLQGLYRSVYSGVTPPPFSEVLQANPNPVQPGEILVFPTPPNGWTKPAG